MINFSAAERSYDRMLAAGPPEASTFTATIQTEVFAEGPYDSAAQVEAWLRQRLGTTATITAIDDDETVRFSIDDEIEEVESEDHAREVIENLIGGGDHQLVVDGVDVQVPELDEPDWDAIEKDRRMERELGL